MNDTLIAAAKTSLYSAVISDTLDGLGQPEHSMAPSIRPLDENLTLFGQARTGLYMEVYHVDPMVNPYELEIKLIDDLKPGEVDRKSTRLNSSHSSISYAVFCLKKKK